MEEGKKLIKKRLNIFQKLRKRLAIINLSAEKYLKLPEDMKNDEEIIEALIIDSPNNISLLKQWQKINIIEKRIDIFKYIPIDEKKLILEENPEYISQLDDEEAITYILNYKDKRVEAIKYLDKRLQKRLLTESRIKSNPKDFGDKLNYFSTEVVEEVIINSIRNEQEAKRKNGYYPYESILNHMSISKLPLETQLRIVKEENDFINIISNETLIKYVGDNFLLFKTIKDVEKTKMLIKANPKFFKLYRKSEQSILLKNNPEMLEIIPIEYCYGLNKICEINEENRENIIKELKKKIVSNNANNDIENSKDIRDNLKDNNAILEIAEFYPSILSINVNDYNIEKQITEIINVYKTKIQNSLIVDALEKYKEKVVNSKYNIRRIYDEMLQISNVLLNDKVIATVDIDLLLEFINNPDIEKMKEIIFQTYGEQVKGIFEDRPNVSMGQIKKLEIFDPVVIENFNIGTVHSMITYGSGTSSFTPYIISELVRHPKKMEQYNLFSKIADEYFENTAIDLEKKLCAFYQFQDLMENLKLEEITEERKRKLLLAINDYQLESKAVGVKSQILEIKTPEDLDNYEVKRNNLYDEYIDKVSSITEIKNVLSRKFFGMSYDNSERRIFS